MITPLPILSALPLPLVEPGVHWRLHFTQSKEQAHLWFLRGAGSWFVVPVASQIVFDQILSIAPLPSHTRRGRSLSCTF